MPVTERFKAMEAWLDAHKEIERQEGAPMFLDSIPDRWLEHGPLFRCENGHVSSRILKSEEEGDLCLAAGCRGKCRITFPEDRETEPHATPIEGPL